MINFLLTLISRRQLAPRPGLVPLRAPLLATGHVWVTDARGRRWLVEVLR